MQIGPVLIQALFSLALTALVNKFLCLRMVDL